MAIAYTYRQLATDLTILGQWENSADINDTVILSAINRSLIKAYDIMVGRWADYFTNDALVAVVPGLSKYSLALVAGDFYKLRHIDFSTDGVRFKRMLPYAIEAEHSFSGVTGTSGRPPRYRLQNGALVVAPPPSSGTMKVWYIPNPFLFVIGDIDDNTTVTFDAPVNADLVLHLAMRDLLIRSDLSTQSVDQTIGELTGMLRVAGDNRDSGEPFYLDPGGPPRDDEDWCY